MPPLPVIAGPPPVPAPLSAFWPPQPTANETRASAVQAKRSTFIKPPLRSSIVSVTIRGAAIAVVERRRRSPSWYSLGGHRRDLDGPTYLTATGTCPSGNLPKKEASLMKKNLLVPERELPFRSPARHCWRSRPAAHRRWAPRRAPAAAGRAVAAPPRGARVRAAAAAAARPAAAGRDRQRGRDGHRRRCRWASDGAQSGGDARPAEGGRHAASGSGRQAGAAEGRQQPVAELREQDLPREQAGAAVRARPLEAVGDPRGDGRRRTGGLPRDRHRGERQPGDDALQGQHHRSERDRPRHLRDHRLAHQRCGHLHDHAGDAGLGLLHPDGDDVRMRHPT